MPTRLITPPAALPVSLAEAKLNLRIDGDEQDSTIEAWLHGITAHAEHITGRSFINQTWRVTLDEFPDAIELPVPVSSVTVKYLDEAGAEQTLDPADYIVDSVSEPGYAVPGVGKAWPTTCDRINAVNVDVVSGYGASEAYIPNGIKTYIIAKLIEVYDPAIGINVLTVGKPYTVSYIDGLLDRYKVYS